MHFSARPSSERRPEPRRTALVARPGRLWAAPALILFAAFAIVPLVLAALLSFTEWNGLGSPRFIGVDNWAALISDARIAQSIFITILILGGNLALQVPISILLGVWSAGFQRWRAVVSALCFIPLVLSSTATSIVWRQLFDPNFGLIATGLATIFGGDGNYIGTRWGAPAVIVMVGTWAAVPFHALIYQGAARAIPETLYEAAQMEGAGRVSMFLNITLPQLRNAIVTSTVFIVVGSLTAFETILILTRGGPGTATTTLPYKMYVTGFQSSDYGYGAASAVVLMLVASLISLVLVRASRYDRMESVQEGL